MRLRNIRGSREKAADSPYVIQEAEKYKGKWKEQIFPEAKELRIEIGMGKGRFLMEMARLYPEISFIGIEMQSSVLLRALQKMEQEPLDNLRFLRLNADFITDYFGEGEVDRIYLNFSDPWPKKRHAQRRLPSGTFLKRYNKILAENGRIEFKTDNRELFDFALEEVMRCNWTREAVSYDLHHDEEMMRGNVMTEYEEKFSSKGNPICKYIISRDPSQVRDRRETGMKFTDMPYKRVELDEMKQGFAKLTKRLKEAGSGEEQFAVHKEYYQFTDHIMTEITLAQIRHSIDTTDPFYEAENDYYDAFLPEYTGCDNVYKKVLYESPYRKELEERIGKVAFKNIEISLKAFDEKLIPLMQEENALVSRYEKLIATAKIEFEGETYNLSLMRKFMTDKEREVRKRAWEAVSAYFRTVTAEIDEIYDAMVKNRTRQAKELGMKDYVELGYLRMNRNSYDRNMVENFRRQVKEAFVPFVGKIQEMRRQQIGVEKLKYYDNDMFFPYGNPAPEGTAEEILKKGQEMYRELSPETAEFIDFMMENELFDVLGRKTKRSGGYMTYLPDYKAPFIFANFNGTNSDVDVITHECGHAFQGYLTRDEEIREHNDLTMETAEIHSMSMEYFTYGWMEKFFGEKKDDYLRMHFEDSVIFIPYGCMVDEYQHIVYSNPDMTPEERKKCWKELESTYRPWLDYDGDEFFGEGGYWQRQGHIFNCPFYYIDYVLASICAMQFKVRMDKDYQDAWEHYLQLCRLSVSDFYVPELEAVGLKSPFADGCIAELTEELEKMV